MNGSDIITVSLKGPRGRAELSSLANLTDVLRKCIANVARCVAGREDVDFDISDLRIASAVISVIPVPNGVPEKVLAEVVSVMHATVAKLEHGGEVDERLDFAALREFSRFSGLVKKSGTSLEFGRTRLSGSYVERIDALIQPYATALGSVTGRLEEFSIHNNSRFKIFPPIVGESVVCNFHRSELPEVLKAVDHNVTVYGKLHYARTKSFPSHVDVDTFDTLPDAEELPSLLDACGSLSGDTPSEKMIRELRDEW
jgi:hypothetical protein